MTPLALCGVIASVGAALAVLYKWVFQPIKAISDQLVKIDKIEKGQKVMMAAVAQQMEHTLSGNNVAELRKKYEELIQFCINK